MRRHLLSTIAIVALLATCAFADAPSASGTSDKALTANEKERCKALVGNYAWGEVRSAVPHDPGTWSADFKTPDLLLKKTMTLWDWDDLPGFCEVNAFVNITKLQDTGELTVSTIEIRLWLPPQSQWRDGKLRFLGTGNGGYAGFFKGDALASGVRKGFAVANTELGMSPSTTGAGGDQLIGNPETWKNFGYRATHEMTEKSKELTQWFYSTTVL